MTADEEDNYHVAQASAPLDAEGYFARNNISGRFKEETQELNWESWEEPKNSFTAACTGLILINTCGEISSASWVVILSRTTLSSLERPIRYWFCSSSPTALIGLINSLASYARINEYGFVEAPYRKIDKSDPANPRVTDKSS